MGFFSRFALGAGLTFGVMYSYDVRLRQQTKAIAADLQNLSKEFAKPALSALPPSQGALSDEYAKRRVAFGEQVKARWNEQVQNVANAVITLDVQEVSSKLVESGKKGFEYVQSKLA